MCQGDEIDCNGPIPGFHGFHPPPQIFEPRFVHGHDFKINMTVTCQHDEKCPSARRVSLYLIAPFNRFSSWEITPSSSMMQMSEELSEFLRKDQSISNQLYQV